MRINVTKPFLPPLNEVNDLLNVAWDNCWLTNDGPLYLELQQKLSEHLNACPNVLMTNGTVTLQIALKAFFFNKKNILTTPFSYVASTSTIVWEQFNPVFIDIDKHTLNVDVNLIEQAIDENTAGMLFTHVFGNACEVEKISEISSKYDIPVIYDAAHAFGVDYNGESIFNYGDISSCSFHATKLFHTVEGGALFSNNEKLLNTCSYMKKFGHDGPDKFHGVGINGKLSEMHSAVGLVNLNYIDELIERRKEQYEYYVHLLKDCELVQFQKISDKIKYNFSYFPVIFNSEIILKIVVEKLQSNNIYPRRYFYPSLNTMDYVEYQSCPISEDISSRILCLPLFHDLTKSDIEKITQILLSSINE